MNAQSANVSCLCVAYYNTLRSSVRTVVELLYSNGPLFCNAVTCRSNICGAHMRYMFFLGTPVNSMYDLPIAFFRPFFYLLNVVGKKLIARLCSSYGVIVFEYHHWLYNNDNLLYVYGG